MPQGPFFYLASKRETPTSNLTESTAVCVDIHVMCLLKFSSVFFTDLYIFNRKLIYGTLSRCSGT